MQLSHSCPPPTVYRSWVLTPSKLIFCIFESTQAICFSLPSFSYSTSGVESTPQIHVGTWTRNTFISACMFLTQASIGQNSGLENMIHAKSCFRLNVMGRLWYWYFFTLYEQYADGLFRDLLQVNDLASMGDMPLLEHSSSTNKWECDHNKESSLPSITLPSATVVDNPDMQPLPVSMSRHVVMPDDPDSSCALSELALGPLPYPRQRV